MHIKLCYNVMYSGVYRLHIYTYLEPRMGMKLEEMNI